MTKRSDGDPVLFTDAEWTAAFRLLGITDSARILAARSAPDSQGWQGCFVTAEIAAAMMLAGEETNAKINRFMSRSPDAFREAVEAELPRLKARQKD